MSTYDFNTWSTTDIVDHIINNLMAAVDRPIRYHDPEEKEKWEALESETQELKAIFRKRTSK